MFIQRGKLSKLLLIFRIKTSVMRCFEDAITLYHIMLPVLNSNTWIPSQEVVGSALDHIELTYHDVILFAILEVF